MSLPKISIICSTFNSAKWIDGYLKNVNGQKLKEFEIIFIDANSNDGSFQTISNFKFREGISPIIVGFNFQISLYEAWNEAILRSSGDYIVNLNTDDRFYDFALELYTDLAAKNPNVDVFYGPCDIVDNAEHSNKVGEFNWPEYSHETMVQQCICGPFPLVKKTTLVEAGLFDGRLKHSGDYEMWIRLSVMGKNFMKIPQTVGSYFFNPVGLSTNPQTRERALAEDGFLRFRYQKDCKYLLSILICTLDNRVDYFNRLAKIIGPQLNKFKNVEVLVAKDNGEDSIGSKRNQLLANCSGEYVVFVDDDDVVSDDYVEQILKALETKPDVVGIHLLHYEDGQHKGLTYHSLKYNSWWDEQNKENPNLRNYYRNPNHLNPVKKMHAIRTMFPSINMGEDKEYSKNLLKYLKTESYIEKPIYTYLFRSLK